MGDPEPSGTPHDQAISPYRAAGVRPGDATARADGPEGLAFTVIGKASGANTSPVNLRRYDMTAGLRRPPGAPAS